MFGDVSEIIDLGRFFGIFWAKMFGDFFETKNVLLNHRPLRLLSIGGGSDETMLAIICKYMGTLPKKK